MTNVKSEKRVVCDGLSFNAFKGVWSARVTVFEKDGHISNAYSIEKSTKKEAKKVAEDLAFDLGLQYKCTVWYKMD